MLVEQLLAQKVYVKVYYFDGDPRVCKSKDQPDVYVSLLQLANKHPNHRLLIFSDGKELMEPLSGQPFQWTRLFFFWQDRALLIPDPLFSDPGHHSLHNSHFLIVPANPDGMADLIQTLNFGTLIKPQKQSRNLPDILLSFETKWCDHHAPDSGQINLLIRSLQIHLDPPTFFWLCACAVYPRLLWPLTLYLGNKLKNENSIPLFKENRLSMLSSLPWFRIGYMPDWLRSKLLDELSVMQEKQVRELLINLLLKVQKATEQDAHLSFHMYQLGMVRRLVSRLLKRIQSDSHPLAPIHDHIFIQFIKNRLSVRISKHIYHRIQKPRKKKIIQEPEQILKQLTKTIKTEAVLQMEFQWIEGGCYMMGQTETEKEQVIEERGKDDYEKYYKRELPRHEVCVNGFWLAKYPVTVGQFRQFIEATNYQTDAEKAGESYTFADNEFKSVKGVNWKNPGFEQDDDHPAVCISWNDAVAMAKWLSEKNQGTIRLPTEAEWEYASRAGTTTARFWGDDPSEACQYANVADLTAKEKINFKYTHNCEDGYVFTSPVGTFLSNPWGLYDMLGNVWEWNADAYDEEAYEKHERNNPIMELEGASVRVLRGGSWFDNPANVRCATRYWSRPDVSYSFTGLRLLWTVKP